MFRRAAVFIFQLDADDRSAVLPQKSFCLVADLIVKLRDVTEITRIVPAQGKHLVVAQLLQPVGEAAVAHFAMAPRANPQQHVQTHGLAGFEEFPQVVPAGPIPDALDFLVVNPKNVGRHDADSAGLYFEQFIAPF